MSRMRHVSPRVSQRQGNMSRMRHVSPRVSQRQGNMSMMGHVSVLWISYMMYITVISFVLYCRYVTLHNLSLSVLFCTIDK